MPLDIAAAVRRVVAGPVTDVVDVRRESLEYDAFLAGRTLARVRGQAVVEGRSVLWSFVEKRTDGPATASAYLYDNGAREFAAYRSGLLTDLAPGLRAPRLLGAEHAVDGALTVWIEDVSSSPRVPLSPEEVVDAARHLGRLAGRWIGRVPEHPWLFRGWIDRHSQPQAIADGLRVVRTGLDHPEIEARIGGRLDEALRLIASQDDYGSTLQGLTQTLCHHDAVAANVFAGMRDGKSETVLIDWESVGPGPVGADLASLLFSSPRRGDFSARLLPELIPRALAAYSAGIADVGASIGADDVRLGLHASIALRWTLVRDVVRILDGQGVAVRGSAPHESSEEALAELLALVPILLDSADETRGLSSGR
jgi:hypothetical protein